MALFNSRLVSASEFAVTERARFPSGTDSIKTTINMDTMQALLLYLPFVLRNWTLDKEDPIYAAAIYLNIWNSQMIRKKMTQLMMKETAASGIRWKRHSPDIVGGSCWQPSSFESTVSRSSTSQNGTEFVTTSKTGFTWDFFLTYPPLLLSEDTWG
jgi:hypothetical protein